MRQSGGAGHRGRNPYHRCLCALSYQPAFTLQSPRRVGKNSTTNPSRFVLLRFLFFFLTHAILFPASLGNTLHAVPYSPLLDSPGSIVSFFSVEYLLFVVQGCPLLLLPTLFRHGLVHSLGIGHVLQDSPGGLRVLFNAIATPLMLSMTSMIPQKVCLAVSHKARVPSTTPGILVSFSSSSKSACHCPQFLYPNSFIHIRKPTEVRLNSRTVNADLPIARDTRQRWAAS